MYAGNSAMSGRPDIRACRRCRSASLTIPKYAFWFDGLGWSVENYGIDPDVEVPARAAAAASRLTAVSYSR
jgi:C-terminal processing protease CtpA/Prc